MEVAGVVLGVVALVGVFEDCVQLLSQIGAAKSMGTDYQILTTKLDIQKTLLLLWGRRLKLLDSQAYDKRLNDAAIAVPIKQGLACIRLLLQDGQELQRRYGLKAADAEELVEVSTTVSDRLMSEFRQLSVGLRGRQSSPPTRSSVTVCAPQHTVSNNNKMNPSAKKIKWVIKDKERFENLIGDITGLIADLDRLILPRSGDDSIQTVLLSEIRDLKNIVNLKMVVNTSLGEQNGPADTAQQTIDKRCTKLILDRLWFRMIDDRENQIAEAHSETFEWSIHAPSTDANWDGLNQWLRVEHDIYWIYGKPGSGKSTLMKFLYQHSEVADLLQGWAGSRQLTTAPFFLWNTGTAEQNTQQGLARGLLYHVLQKNEALLPICLPKMWKEAQGGCTSLELPSEAELKWAFQQLREQSTNGAFAFFIDGLDEFKGNHRDGIKFIKGLVTSANVKILLSSRPLDTCVAAFDSKPKLRLQDLTRHDIDLYINGVMQAHPYIAGFSHLSEATVEDLIMELQRKADGVFLWVVLACRALLEGFEACDNAEELRRRVDELPPELGNLFHHILQGLPSQYLQQAAKLLRVCFCAERDGLGPVATLSLGWADEGNMDLDKLEYPKTCSIEEVKQKCKLLEGRLRSRCRGLLEVDGDVSSIDLGDYKSLTTHAVNFMHRTVFEFLSQSDTWELGCLEIQDENFEPIAIASYTESYILHCYNGVITTSEFQNGIVKLDRIAEKAPMYLARTLRSFTSALIQPRDIEEPFFGKTQFNLSLEEAMLLIAVEKNWTTLIREQEVKDFNLSRGLTHKGSHRVNNLLYHRFYKPLHGYGFRFPDNVTMELLLRLGCDPNESIVDNDGDITPVWEVWRGLAEENVGNSQDAMRAAAITLLLIRHGAILTPPASATWDYRPDFIHQVQQWPAYFTMLSGTSVSETGGLRENCDKIIEAIEESYKIEPQWGNRGNYYTKEDNSGKKRKNDEVGETESADVVRFAGSPGTWMEHWGCHNLVVVTPYFRRST